MRIITRHNINLAKDELATLGAHLFGDDINTGDENRRFEDDFARYHGVDFAIAVGSGRAALYAILMALHLPPDAEVLVPAYSFYTVPQVVEAAGARPVFVACDPRRYGLDPEALKAAIGPKTRAVIVEHPFGQAADMAAINAVARSHKLAVIEDPSQSIGARLSGRVCGSFGRAACFSFVHGKNLMTFGGGMIVTNDEALYGRMLATLNPQSGADVSALRKLVFGGLAQWGLSSRVGFALGPFAPFYALNLLNRRRLDDLFTEEQLPFSPSMLSPLSNLQAALGRLQLQHLDARNAIRRRNGLRLLEGLANAEGLGLPSVAPDCTPTFNAFPVRVKDGTAFQRSLMLRGVDTRADYMSLFADEAEWTAHGDVVYLPSHPALGDTDIDYVIAQVKKVLSR